MGTSRRDVIVGLGGGDRIQGRGGGDILCGGGGADVLRGGGGADFLSGGSSHDKLLGDGGKDVLSGGLGYDREWGGRGDDRFAEGSAPNGADALHGESGFDTADYSARSGRVDVSLDASWPNDGACSGEGEYDDAETEAVLGGRGNDTLRGSEANNAITGGAGHDLMDASNGQDRLQGGDGDDILIQYGSDDVVDGGAGTNREITCADLRTCDVEPPGVAAVGFSPTTVDTSQAARTIGVHVRLTDNLAGAMRGTGVFTSPSGRRIEFYLSDACTQGGTELDDTFSYPMVVPRFSEQGTWTLSEIRVWDRVANQHLYTTSELEAAGVATTFAQTGAGDVEPPRIAAFGISPTTIDTSGADRQITIDLRVTDNMAGVSWSGPISSIGFRGPGGSSGGVGASFSEWNKLSGTPTDAWYRVHATIPRYSPQGTWYIDGVRLVDRAGNVAVLSTQQLADASFPHSFDQVGVGDTGPPEITSLTIQPAQVDTSAADRTLTFTFGGRDDLSGIEDGWARFVSPTAGQVLEARFFDPSNRVAGSPTDGVWRVETTLRRYSEHGVWKLDSIRVRDATWTWRRIGLTEAKSLGLTTEFRNGP